MIFFGSCFFLVRGVNEASLKGVVEKGELYLLVLESHKFRDNFKIPPLLLPFHKSELLQIKF